MYSSSMSTSKASVTFDFAFDKKQYGSSSVSVHDTYPEWSHSSCAPRSLEQSYSWQSVAVATTGASVQRTTVMGRFHPRAR